MTSCSSRIATATIVPIISVWYNLRLRNLFMTIMTIMLMMMMTTTTTITTTILICSDDISHVTQSHIYTVYLSLQTKILLHCQFMIQIPLVPGHPNLLQSFRLRIGVRPLAKVPWWRVRRCGQTGPPLGSSDGFKSAISESSSPKPLKMMLLQLNWILNLVAFSHYCSMIGFVQVCYWCTLVHLSMKNPSSIACPFSRRF